MSTPTPLLLDIILDRIFQYMTASQLIKIRSVCQQWYRIAQPCLLEKIDQIQINFYEINEYELAMRCVQEGVDVGPADGDDLVALYQFRFYIADTCNPEATNFTNFYVKGCSFLVHPVGQEFLNMHGVHLKSLKINFEAGFVHESTREQMTVVTFMDLLFKQCVNLERLELVGIPASLVGHALMPVLQDDKILTTRIHTLILRFALFSDNFSANFIRDLVSLLPNLREIKFIINSVEDVYHQNGQVLLQFLRISGGLKTLRNLTLSYVGPAVIRGLNRCKEFLKLTYFEAQVLYPSTAEDEFLEFLNSQSSWLQTLICRKFLTTTIGTVSEAPPPQDKLLSFPVAMPSLTTLVLGQEYFSVNKIAPIDLSKQFPSLRSLLIQFTKDPETWDPSTLELHPNDLAPLFQSNTPHTFLTALELPSLISPELMERIGPLLPNLTHLCLGYQDGIGLGHVWRNWRDLESLYICAHSPPTTVEKEQIGLEELLTGFDKDQMRLAAQNKDFSEQPKFPAITNLSKLRQLTIYGGSSRNGGFVTSPGRWNIIGDIAFRHAFSKMKGVEYLHITVENEVAGIYVMRESCPNLQLRFAPDRDFIHLESETFHRQPHSMFQI